ncbi:uncharacterized protein [Physeter macrocephalus]|uniref:Uncharacterized protein isoform X2 n=1 Tax=Physeter macrocephalus TaxID=9755 RepID=A0A9W2WD76_PHYMC|nr:uncharacterized protein LOC129391666 isoform X2 [Physeter catodon]
MRGAATQPVGPGAREEPVPSGIFRALRLLTQLRGLVARSGLRLERPARATGFYHPPPASVLQWPQLPRRLFWKRSESGVGWVLRTPHLSRCGEEEPSFPTDKLIGVCCTNGINRTGYLICRNFGTDNCRDRSKRYWRQD